MSDRWFRLSETGTGSRSDPHRPKYVRERGLDWAGNNIGRSPQWVARVYGPTDDLDALAAEPDVTELSGVPVQALNSAFGQDRDAAGWERGFRVDSE